MADISYDEMARSLGGSAGDALTDIANVAADAFCDVFQAVPSAIVSSPLNNPGAQFADGLARRICAPRNKLPPDAQPPFSGGQCECQSYTITYKRYSDGELIGTESTVQPGPISGPSLGGSGDNKDYGVSVGTAACGGRRRYNFISGFSKFENAVGGQYVEIVSVAPLGGATDACGDPPPEYEQRMPSLDDLKRRLPIPVGGQPIDVDVTIKPVDFQVGVQFKPEFNIQVGGIQVNLDITGAKIQIGPTIQLPPVLPPGQRPPGYNEPPYLPPGESPGLAPINDKLDAIEEALDELKDCDRCKDNYTYTTTVFESANSRIVTSLAKPLFQVVLTLTEKPINAKMEPGMEAPDVVYSGWFWFLIGGSLGERMPIDSNNKFYNAPEGATGFAYTTRVGFSASCLAIQRERSLTD
jgi:hypothetical protein